MQLRIFINLGNNPLELPIAHHHILASIYYRLMGSEQSMVHDQGKKYGKREYRLFTFGPIIGKYSIDKQRKHIRFFDHIEMEFRSVNRNMILEMVSNALASGVTFGNVTYTDVHCDVSEFCIKSKCIEIEMVSPICIYRTHKVCERRTFRKKRRVLYYTPQMRQFTTAIVGNFTRKYSAARGELPDDNVRVEVVSIGSKDKYLTRYKENTIEAYKGIYRLYGPAEYLTFLYDVGLGGKNSQGFGLFRVRRTTKIG